MIKFKVKTEMNGVDKKLSKYHQAAQPLLSSEVLKDSNNYAPQDTGNLIASSQRSSDFEKGKLIWDTKYARKLYYNSQYHFSKDKNPNAQGLWFEAARSSFFDRWINVLEALKKRHI
ncbi:minor capsid protein [Bacillus sp. WMMC1349]|uniref:minor capsid protein n=1 Tax=Bacillus sp. WMMC1349 TaxID=2736254 RepID=UPI001555E54D|nr:minor capsid protein [Bacillus sp. WMMC1349]NPC91220.1 minor capsid protein [Bacillus sp. WMMC1349]